MKGTITIKVSKFQQLPCKIILYLFSQESNRGKKRLKNSDSSQHSEKKKEGYTWNKTYLYPYFNVLNMPVVSSPT